MCSVFCMDLFLPLFPTSVILKFQKSTIGNAKCILCSAKQEVSKICLHYPSISLWDSLSAFGVSLLAINFVTTHIFFLVFNWIIKVYIFEKYLTTPKKYSNSVIKEAYYTRASAPHSHSLSTWPWVGHVISRSPSYLIIEIEIMSDTWQRQTAGWGGILRSLPTRKSVSFWVHKGQRTFPKSLDPSVWASTCSANRIMGPTQASLEAEIKREGGVEAFLPAVMDGKSMRQMMGKRKRQDEAGVCSLELSVLCTIYMLINHKMYVHQGFRAQDTSHMGRDKKCISRVFWVEGKTQRHSQGFHRQVILLSY